MKKIRTFSHKSLSFFSFRRVSETSETSFFFLLQSKFTVLKMRRQKRKVSFVVCKH